MYTEEQLVIVDQINSLKPNQFYEMIGVSEGAEEDEIRAQYKKVLCIYYYISNMSSLRLFYILIRTRRQEQGKHFKRLRRPLIW